MLAELNIIEGAYLQDVLSQPEALRNSLNEFEETLALRTFSRDLNSARYKRILLTGMGSSLYALYPLHLTLTNAGFPSLLIETSELIHYLTSLLDPHTLVVAVSQSGQSAEIVRLLEINQGRAPLIGVTNNPDSFLAGQANVHLLMRAGVESSVSCKTYVASLLALEWLGGILTGGDLVALRGELHLATAAVAGYLADWRQHVAEMSALLAGVKHMFLAGRGPSLATAQTGGLILKESAHFAAEGMSCAAFRHGPFEALAHHVLVVVFAGDARSQALNRRLSKDVEQAGGRSALVQVDARVGVLRIPKTPDLIRPIIEILPVQMISLVLAAHTGREAGRFQLASKITSIE